MFSRRYCLLLTLLFPLAVSAAESVSDDQPKVVSGMSIVGNNETPKSLYIVPWKSSEIGTETKLNSSLLDADMAPVDKSVFMRELDFYNVSVAK